MTVTAILQARLSSRRLPGKVLADVCGRPMLARQIERLRLCRQIDSLVLATSFDAEDDALAEFAEWMEIPCVRGPLDDVLDRFAKAANTHPADHFLRLTGDCPLNDPELIDDLIDFHKLHGYDYSSLRLAGAYPQGLDAEVMTAATLRDTWRYAETAHDREHVTPYIQAHPEMFRVGAMPGPGEGAARRWAVDFPEDLEFVRALFEALLPDNPDFSWGDVTALLEARPDIAAINAERATSDAGTRSHESEAELS